MRKLCGMALATGLVICAGGLVHAQPSSQQSGQLSARQRAIADLKQNAYAGDVNAQVQLGVIYLTGDGIARDDTEAVKWLRMAAAKDSPIGERYLAEMYFKGRGVPADNDEAARWLRMAAEQGDAQSEYNLAVLYTQGMGVPRNLKIAADWMRKSADQNLAAGQLGMGVIYDNGDGTPEDPVEAARWYRKAVDQDNIAAMNNLARLMATTKNPAVRNTQGAIALATKAVGTGGNPEYLDTLAEAYFADGQNDKAVETEQKALARAPDNEAYQKALQKYLSAAHGGK